MKNTRAKGNTQSNRNLGQPDLERFDLELKQGKSRIAFVEKIPNHRSLTSVAPSSVLAAAEAAALASTVPAGM
jgi:hypothetical protein